MPCKGPKFVTPKLFLCLNRRELFCCILFFFILFNSTCSFSRQGTEKCTHVLTFFRPLERHTTKASTHPTPNGYQFHPFHIWTCRRGKKHLAILHIKIGSSATLHTHYILTDLFLNKRNNSIRHAHVSCVIIHNIPVVIRFNLAPRSNYCYLLSHYAFFPQNFVGLSE